MNFNISEEKLSNKEQLFEKFKELLSEKSGLQEDTRNFIDELWWFCNLRSRGIKVCQVFDKEKRKRKREQRIDLIEINEFLLKNKEVLEITISKILRENKHRISKNILLENMMFIDGFKEDWKRDYVADFIKDFIKNKLNYQVIRGNGRGEEYAKVIFKK